MFKDILNDLYIMLFNNESEENKDYRIFDEMFEEQLKTEMLKEEIKRDIIFELKNDANN